MDDKISFVAILSGKETFKIRSGNKSDILNSALFDFLHNICKATGKEAKGFPRWDVQVYVQRETRNEGYNAGVTYEVPKAIGDAIGDFRWRLDDGLKDLLEQGKKEGRNLLVQLNNGEISMKDFNESAEE